MKYLRPFNESRMYGVEILPGEARKELQMYVNFLNPENKIEVYPDPQVDGTYAVRIFRAEDNHTFDLLWNRGGFDEISSDENEDGFSTWPPKSGNLNFF